MGVKIILNDEETKRFKSLLIEPARRILAERKKAARLAEIKENKSTSA